MRTIRSSSRLLGKGGGGVCAKFFDSNTLHFESVIERMTARIRPMNHTVVSASRDMSTLPEKL